MRRRAPPNVPVADQSDASIRRYRKSKTATLDDLYDWLCAAGLSPEEAQEVCNLEEEQ